MYATRMITDEIVYVGVEDRRLRLFENLFPIERGVTYNSYLILDEKTALLDTVDQGAGKSFFENIRHALNGRKLDYLIVNHMEPDHCALIAEIFRTYPELTIVANLKTFQMIGQFFAIDIPDDRKLLVKEGDELNLGRHVLKFVFAPMVHWPEVMFTYDSTDGILFSADAFGTFGTNNGNIFNDEIAYKECDFVDDARRYYSNIVGKYGTQTQSALKKAAGIDIKMICPLHGPVWRSDLSFILSLYQKWSKYEAETNSVAIFYNSVYGNTESVINSLALLLAEKGIKGIRVYDVSKTDVSYLIGECFRVSNLVFGATTYNNGLFPKMENLLSDMKTVAVQNKKVSIIENGSWAPQSGKLVTEALKALKNIEFVGDKLTIKSASFSVEALEKLADDISKSL